MYQAVIEEEDPSLTVEIKPNFVKQVSYLAPLKMTRLIFIPSLREQY